VAQGVIRGEFEMNIVGIYDFPGGSFRAHDKAAAIISSESIYSYEEAKISEVKEDGYASFPERALMMGFKELNLRPDAVDLWAFPCPPQWVNQGEILKNFFENVIGIKFKSEIDFDEFHSKKVSTILHHDAHIALGGHTAPFKNGLILSMDGGGDYGDSHHVVCKKMIEGVIDELPIISGSGSEGLANFHGWLSESVGFTEDGKCSGISGYGSVNEELYEQLSKFLIWDEEGYFKFIKNRTALKYYGLEKIKIDSYDRRKFLFHQPGLTNIHEAAKNYKPQDIAATGTKLIIDCLNIMLQTIKTKSNLDNIALVGGLFNNVAINKSIVESNIFKSCHFTMAPGDAGLALGLALQTLHSVGKSCIAKGQLFSPYIGPSFKNNELKILLDQMKLNYQYVDDSRLGSYIAEKISLGATVGTFYGRAECGPRSLGHRSILGDARNKDTKQKINLNLKKRDWFMPYAPAILVEDALEWTNISPSPYMQIASMVHDIKKTLIPSAVHVDGTARFQAVHRELSPFFYDVIQNFKSLTGVPIVLNTSFNRHGIATISSPRSAIHHLLEGTVDILILGNFVISLSENRIMGKASDQPTAKDEESLLMEFEMNHKNKILEMERLINSHGN